MNQRAANPPLGNFVDTRGYRLRLVITAVVGALGSSLNLLAARGDTKGSTLPTEPLQLPLALPIALAFGLLALASFGLFGEMGYWVARREGAMRSGVRAAFGAGIAFGLGDALPSVGALVLQGGIAAPPTLRGSMFPLLVISVVATYLVVYSLLVGIIGALVGGMGAIIGRSPYRRQRNDLTLKGEYRE